jgi:hypothetical protein
MHTWAILILFLLASNIEAQELPSEVDLRAAYCLPIVQHDIHFFTSATREEQDPDVKAFYDKKLIPRLTEDLRRLRLYLLPRLHHLDSVGITIAIQRAKADLAKHEADWKTCTATCDQGSNALYVSCVSACKTDPTFDIRLKGCADLRWLPF